MNYNKIMAFLVRDLLAAEEACVPKRGVSLPTPGEVLSYCSIIILFTSMGGVPREQKMLKGHLPSVIITKYTSVQV